MFLWTRRYLSSAVVVLVVLASAAAAGAAAQSPRSLAGAQRAVAKPGESISLAVEVYPPQPHDLSITLVDWAPMPPDKEMGIWREVRINATGPISLRYPAVMSKLVSALDRAWNYYANTTGRTPRTNRLTLNGRDEIAEVSSMNPPNSCGGAACTYIGQTGTEILTQYFEHAYQQIAQHNLYDQPLFYELGRSFWFWGDQLAFKSPDLDPVVTGFAVLMRFESMAAAGVNGAPYNGTPFATFQSQVAALAGQYEADPSLTFAQTLAQDRSPGAFGGTDFWASLMLQLIHRHGGQLFLSRFFHHAGSLPAASSTTDAVTNWVRDAGYAACVNLAPVFYRRWGFPRPDGHVTKRPNAASVPEPHGSCHR